MSQNTPDFAIVDLKATQEIVRRAPCGLTLAVYVLVRARTNNRRQSWRMTVESIAVDLGGREKKRSVQRALAWLEEEGFLLRDRRGMARGKRIVTAGPGARELESDFWAPGAPLPPQRRRCGHPRSSARALVCTPAHARARARAPACSPARLLACTCACSPVCTSACSCGDQIDFIGISADQPSADLCVVSRTAPAVEKVSEGVGRADTEFSLGVTALSPLPQEFKEEEFPSVVSPPRRPERKDDRSSPPPTPTSAALSTTKVTITAEAELGDFGLGEASTVSASRCPSRCRRRSVTVEMVDLLTEATLNAVAADPHNGWLYRCRHPDEQLVLSARDLLRDQRKAGSYSGTLCKRTIRRGLRRVWRLCNHLPSARVLPGAACLGAVS